MPQLDFTLQKCYSNQNVTHSYQNGAAVSEMCMPQFVDNNYQSVNKRINFGLSKYKDQLFTES